MFRTGMQGFYAGLSTVAISRSNRMACFEPAFRRRNVGAEGRFYLQQSAAESPFGAGPTEAYQQPAKPGDGGFSRHDSDVQLCLRRASRNDTVELPGEAASGSAGTQPDKEYPGLRCANRASDPWKLVLPGVVLIFSFPCWTSEECL